MSAVRYVDLSGFAFTGKQAVSDLLREVDGLYVPDAAFEFAMVRAPGGLLDLEDALAGDWSPVRSDGAIRRFRRLVKRAGTSMSLARPRSLFESIGWNYDEVYGGRFFELSRQYVARLVALEWNAPWPFAYVDMGAIELGCRRIAARLGIASARRVRLTFAAPRDFLEATRDYLDALLWTNVPAGTTTVVLHNVLEPYAPARGMRLFRGIKAIVVDRDPRDSYVDGSPYRWFAADVGDFIRKYRLQREAVATEPNPDVLRMKFEDLVLEPAATSSRVLAHIGAPRQSRPGAYFSAERSRRNVGQFRNFSRPDDIRRIEQELAGYCDARL